MAFILVVAIKTSDYPVMSLPISLASPLTVLSTCNNEYQGLTVDNTVGDVIALVKNCSDSIDADYNIEDFPLPKTKKHIRQLKRYMNLSRFFWRFEVSGLENVFPGGQYILCPNHQSHFDSLWIWGAIAKNRPFDLHKICCLAKQEHLESKFSRSWLTLLGGIPVDRSGNTVPAMQRGHAMQLDGYVKFFRCMCIQRGILFHLMRFEVL